MNPNTAGRYQAVPGSAESMRRAGELRSAGYSYRESARDLPRERPETIRAASATLVRLSVIAALILALILLLAGCGTIPAQVESDMRFGFQAWEQDKRPTLPDADYGALDDERRELYMPESRDKARRAFWRQALKTAAHGKD